MTAPIMLDTLAYANQLKAAGVPSAIAEAHAIANAQLIHGLVDTTLATKQDINHLEKDFHVQLKDLETRLTLRVGIIVGSGFGIFTAITSFLHLVH